MSCDSTFLMRTIPCTILLFAILLGGCAYRPADIPMAQLTNTDDYVYTIAPGDRLNIFVWRNEDISVSNIPVMPDGRISTPLVEQMVASGKTPAQLADDIEQALSRLITDPHVTVTVINFEGSYAQTVRVVGEAAVPSAIPYRNGMSLLDVIIAVGGLTEFAAGNRATIVRNQDGRQEKFRVRLEDLVKRGDLGANTRMVPGDILIIPESLF
jgi:polysaccharide export outer membrane protein